MTPHTPNADRTRLPRRVFLALAAAFLAGCGGSSPTATQAPGGTRAVSLQTDWFAQAEHGGYYQAQAKGFYAEAGMTVEIRQGGPNAQVLQNVAAGRADFGMTNGDDVLVAIARGIPVVILAAEMQRDPQGILFHASNPLSSFRDLDGRTIMAGVGSTWIQYLQKHYAIRFNLQPLMGDLTRFLGDPQFIQQCFVTNEPFFVRQRGVEAGTLLIATSGYEPYRVIFTSRALFEREPEFARAFARASVRGWSDFMEGDPQPAFAAVAALNPNMTPELMAFSRRALAEYRLVSGDPARGETTGQITRARLQHQIDILRDLGIIETPLDPAAVTDPEILR